MKLVQRRVVVIEGREPHVSRFNPSVGVLVYHKGVVYDWQDCTQEQVDAPDEWWFAMCDNPQVIDVLES